MEAVDVDGDGDISRVDTVSFYITSQYDIPRMSL